MIKLAVKTCIFLLVFFLLLTNLQAGDVTLIWSQPVLNEDGTVLTDLAGYKVYYGTRPGSYEIIVDVGNVTSYFVPDLMDGSTYYFSVTAYDRSGNESGFSQVLTLQSLNYYCDNDNDGHVNLYADGSSTGVTPSGCGRIPGDDCNDSNAAIHPGQADLCDSLDNDCNGTIDEGVFNCNTGDIDIDGDGYTPGNGDCDDTDRNVYPGASRICDGKDSDCNNRPDFSTDVDLDGDGVALCALDCNDSNPNMYPGNHEGPQGDPSCSDGIDNDCDGNRDAFDDGC